MLKLFLNIILIISACIAFAQTDHLNLFSAFCAIVIFASVGFIRILVEDGDI